MDAQEEIPRLSPSIAHLLVTECPAEAWQQHRLLGGGKPLSKSQVTTRERGSALHSLILEEGRRLFTIEAADYRTKAAQATAEQARAEGWIPVLAPVKAELEEAAENIVERCAQMGIRFDSGRMEQRIEWTEPALEDDVACSAVLDWLSEDGMIVRDLKTTTGSVRPEQCLANLLDSPGIIQAAAYPSAIVRTDPERAGRVKFQAICAQSVPPYLVTPIEPPGDALAIGETRWLQALDVWAKCLAANRWPGHCTGIERPAAPPWIFAREEEREARIAAIADRL